jgi:hypothetical protein
MVGVLVAVVESVICVPLEESIAGHVGSPVSYM